MGVITPTTQVAIASGTAAARPSAASASNSYYYATDTNTLSYSNGSAWTSIVSSGGGGGTSLTLYQAGSPASTTSTTAVMAGLGSTVTFTPASTGKVWIRMQGLGWVAGSADTVSILGKYGTGAAPANGAAVSGTSWGPVNQQVSTPGASLRTAWQIEDKITGLTLSTAYWFDLTQVSSIGNATHLQNVTATLIEVQ